MSPSWSSSILSLEPSLSGSFSIYNKEVDGTYCSRQEFHVDVPVQIERFQLLKDNRDMSVDQVSGGRMIDHVIQDWIQRYVI